MKLELNLTEQQHERFLRLLQDTQRHATIESLFEEMLNLADWIHAGRAEGYTDLIIRNPHEEDKRKKDMIILRRSI